MPEKTKTKPRSEAYKNEMRIGKLLADALPQYQTQSEVAKSLGITRQAVARIERRALFKLRQRVLEITNRDELAFA